MKTHFDFVNSGSIIQIFALTDVAIDWLNDNLALESWQWFGNSIAIETRYFDNIYSAIENEF